MKVKLSIVCLLAVLAFAVCVGGAPTNEDKIASGTTSPANQVRAGFSPAKLFDFDNYKTVFHKTYSGMLEEMVRAKYFLSRAFRAFISAMKYKYRQSPYYLAVNEMSDWTPDEFRKSENKVLAAASKARLSKKVDKNAPPPSAEFDDELPEMLPENVEEAEKELKRMAESAAEPDELKDLASNSTSRGPAKRHSDKLRELPMEKLIDTGADAKLNPAAARKLTNSVPSDNPQYEQLELPSFGLRDEPKEADFWIIESEERSTSTLDFMNSLGGAFSRLRSFGSQNGAKNDESEGEAKEDLPDEVFVDLRDTGCLTLPRRQGKCGSCWAFAGIAIFEFIYCMKTGKLVQFSEQYLIDCGTPYIEGANGCEGGIDYAPANFVKNFGLELRAHYPYEMRQNQCPYEESTDLKRTGYIRFQFQNAVQIDLDLWDEHVEHSPLWIGVAWYPHFNEYGGGVFGWGCDKEFASHAVVLVGHGREDGHEYWLIRNSHSVGWGEGGYGKLAKKANCTPERHGYTYATRDGERIRPRISTNKLNDGRAVKSHYVQQNLQKPAADEAP